MSAGHVVKRPDSGGVVRQQSGPQGMILFPEPRPEVLRHHRVIVERVLEPDSMPHLMRQNAEEGYRHCAAGKARLVPGAERAPVDIGRVGWTENPVVEFWGFG